MTTPLLQTQGLSVGYGGAALLQGVDVALQPGTLTTLIGANGCGKSTLLRTLAGVQKAICGEIRLGSENIARQSIKSIARQLTMVFTSAKSGGGLTAEETVAIGRTAHTGLLGRMSKSDREIVLQSLHEVGMDKFRHRPVGTLSDGERQKVMIARALAQCTPVIMLDEPTSFLDVAGRIEISALLRRLADSGRAIVLSSHDLSSAIAVADTLWIVDKAQKQLIVAPKDLALEQNLPSQAFPSLIFDKNTLNFHN